MEDADAIRRGIHEILETDQQIITLGKKHRSEIGGKLVEFQNIPDKHAQLCWITFPALSFSYLPPRKYFFIWGYTYCQGDFSVG